MSKDSRMYSSKNIMKFGQFLYKFDLYVFPYLFTPLETMVERFLKSWEGTLIKGKPKITSLHLELTLRKSDVKSDTDYMIRAENAATF